MAEKTLYEITMNHINWLEFLYERNIKSEAQVERLMRELAEARNRIEQLEAQNLSLSSACQNNQPEVVMNTQMVPTATIHQQQVQHNQPHLQHQQHPPLIYHQPFPPQPASYVWAYETIDNNCVNTI